MTGLTHCHICSLAEKDLVKSSTFLCCDCKLFLCDNCSSKHAAIKLFDGHKLIPIKESFDCKFCHCHGLIMDKKCMSHQKSVCVVCVHESHSNCKLLMEDSKETCIKTVGRVVEDTEINSDTMELNAVSDEAYSNGNNNNVDKSEGKKMFKIDVPKRCEKAKHKKVKKCLNLDRMKRKSKRTNVKDKLDILQSMVRSRGAFTDTECNELMEIITSLVVSQPDTTCTSSYNVESTNVSLSEDDDCLLFYLMIVFVVIGLLAMFIFY